MRFLVDFGAGRLYFLVGAFQIHRWALVARWGLSSKLLRKDLNVLGDVIQGELHIWAEFSQRV